MWKIHNEIRKTEELYSERDDYIKLTLIII